MLTLENIIKRDECDVLAVFQQLESVRRHRDARILQVGCNSPLRTQTLVSLTHNQITTDRDGRSVILDRRTKKVIAAATKPILSAATACRFANPQSEYLFEHGRRSVNDVPHATAYSVNRVLRMACAHLENGRRLVLSDYRRIWGRRLLLDCEDLNFVRNVLGQGSVERTISYLGLEGVALPKGKRVDRQALTRPVVVPDLILK